MVIAIPANEIISGFRNGVAGSFTCVGAFGYWVIEDRFKADQFPWAGALTFTPTDGWRGGAGGCGFACDRHRADVVARKGLRDAGIGVFRSLRCRSPGVAPRVPYVVSLLVGPGAGGAAIEGFEEMERLEEAGELRTAVQDRVRVWREADRERGRAEGVEQERSLLLR